MNYNKCNISSQRLNKTQTNNLNSNKIIYFHKNRKNQELQKRGIKYNIDKKYINMHKQENNVEELQDNESK
jgi:hypothetical protein